MQKARKKEEAVSSVLFEQHGMRQSLIITEQEEKVFKSKKNLLLSVDAAPRGRAD